MEHRKGLDHRLQETVLSGGNVNTVVRIGDTVRRDTGPHSATVHEFLSHLNAKSAPVPRFLGIDEHGREILTFIEGETGVPKDIWKNDRILIACARMLRAFHDASLDFVPASPARWAFEYPGVMDREVICHNDFAPYNMVFRDGLPVAILDFDLCGPGPRLRDLAYLAYWITPLSFGSADLRACSENDIRQGSRRLRLICQTYGIETARALPAMVSEVLHHMGDETAVQRMVGLEATERLKSGGHLQHWLREAAAFDAMQDALVANLA